MSAENTPATAEQIDVQASAAKVMDTVSNMTFDSMLHD